MKHGLIEVRFRLSAPGFVRCEAVSVEFIPMCGVCSTLAGSSLGCRGLFLRDSLSNAESKSIGGKKGHDELSQEAEELFCIDAVMVGDDFRINGDDVEWKLGIVAGAWFEIAADKLVFAFESAPL